MITPDDGRALTRGRRTPPEWRPAAAILALLALLASVCFVILAADHDHSGDDCAVCTNIAEHLSFFRAPAAVSERACGILPAAALILPDNLSLFTSFRHPSPITLKVKLSA